MSKLKFLKDCCANTKLNFFILFLAICLTNTTNYTKLSAQIFLPSERKGDWQSAGYLRFQNLPLPVVKTNSVLAYGALNNGNDSNNTNYQAIMAAINDRDTSGFTRIYFPPGQYKISQAVQLNNLAKISLVGAGSDQTKLLFDLGGQERQASIYLLNCQQVGLENFYITRLDSIGDNIDNQSSNFGNNIQINASRQCFISGIESYKAISTHLSVYNSSSLEIRGSYFHECYTYGTSGHGYGIVLGGPDTKMCLIEDNIFQTFRHAMILSNAPEDNVFGYNYSREPYTTETYLSITDWASDMCFHGHPDSALTGPVRNLFEGNIGSFMNADDAWGANGQYNTYFRNRATYYGIKISSSSPSQNIIANELDDKDGMVNQSYGDIFWNAFDIAGANHFVTGNTDRDKNPPQIQKPFSGDLSLYFSIGQLPDFLADNGYFPPIGAVDSTHLGGGSIPAKNRYFTAGSRTVTSYATSIKVDMPIAKTPDLLICYPNPFNDKAIISFQLYEKDYYRLQIYNSLGQVVRNIFSGELTAEMHSFGFRAADLPSGIYYVTLSNGQFGLSKKTVLLK